LFIITLIIFLSVTILVVSISVAVRSQEISARKDVQERLKYIGQNRPSEAQKEKNFLVQAVDGYQSLVNKYLPKDYSDKLEKLLDKADLDISVTEIVALHIMGYLIIATIFFILTKVIIISLLFGGIGLCFPLLFIRMKIKKRNKQFNDLLVDTSTLIANILKAGFGLRQALQVIAEEMASPVREEFSKVLQEVQYGLGLEEALTNLTKRVDSKDLDLLVTAILIQLEIGGNLSEILEKIAETIRDRIKIIGEVNALTAQGKMSGIMVGALPWLIALFVYFFNPDYISLLWTTFPGMVILGCALVLLAIGAGTISILVKIEF